MHLILPAGFNSWTQVLTDWGVSRALSTFRLPGCLADRPQLAVPFVAHIGAAIRHKQLHRRSVEAALIAQQVTEPAYDQAGGPGYLKLFTAIEGAQDRFIEAWLAERNTSSETGSPQLASLQADMERYQADVERLRKLYEPYVRAARTAAVRAHWAGHQLRGIPDTFFADAAHYTVPARMQRIHPPWWGAFLGRLQQPLAHGHPAEGYLLDALPRLRAAAKKKTLAAMIDEWRAEQNDNWGWYGKTHYRMLARRAVQKAGQLTRWFDTRAPGYLTNDAVRFTLDSELADRLIAADPWSVSMPTRNPYEGWTEHWRN